MRRWLGHTFAALEGRDFRILWIGTLLSFIGFFMSTVVQSVVAFELTSSNTAVGLVVFGQGLMMFVLGPIGGAFADRWSKRRVIATCQSGTTLVFFTLAALCATDRITVIWLTIGAMTRSASSRVGRPRWPASSESLIRTIGLPPHAEARTSTTGANRHHDGAAPNRPQGAPETSNSDCLAFPPSGLLGARQRNPPGARI